MHRRPVQFGIVFLALVALGLLFAFRAAVFRTSVGAAIGLATGYGVSFQSLAVSGSGLSASGLHVERFGEPILDADGVDVRYDVRELVFGGAHRFGLQSIVLERPRFSLVRHADGGWNLWNGSVSPGQPAGSAGAASAPLAFSATVHAGSITILDPYRALRIARRISIGALDATAVVNSAGRSAYRLSGTFAGRPPLPFELRGRVDANGFAMHRLRAALVSIVPVADYFINTPSAEMADGVVHGLDVRVYSFGAAPGASPAYHIAATGQLEDGTMHLPALLPALTRMSGRIDLYDDGLVSPDLRARLGGIDVRAEGGLYDRNAPQFRLGIVAARAPLHDLRAVFNFSKALPLAGTARVSAVLESAVGAPLVATRVDAPRIAYAGFPIAAVSGRAVYYRNAIDVVGARGNYGGLAAAVDGAIALGPPAYTQLVARADGPAAAVPYAAQVAPLAQLHAAALIEGDGVKLDARGAAAGSGGGSSLSGLFHVDPAGDGVFGPLRVASAGGGNAAGAFYLNRSAGQSGFWLEARDYPFARLPGDPHLPALTFAPPVFGALLDGAVAGVGPPSNFRVAGTVHARAFDAGGVHIDAVSASIAGQLANLRLGAVAADGPWGSFHGTGAYQQNTLALEGNYRGSFAQLRTLTGDLGASGPVDGPVALLVSPQRTLVQARSDASRGATVYGVPVDRLSGTLAIAGKTVRVYGATASVAGGTFAAAGDSAGARGIGVSVAGADALRLHAIAPLGSGRVDAIGSVRTDGIANARTGSRAPRFTGGLAVGEATLDRLPIAGNGDLTLDGSRLDVRTTDAHLGAALGSFDGSLDNLGSGAPRYDLNVRIAEARIAPFAHIADPERHDIAGTASGAVRVFGTAQDLSANGHIAVPEGTVNGLAFSAASAGVRITRTGLFVEGGTVTVGTTQTAFGAAFDGLDASMHLDAARADLADFNDYFDAGDTLGGKGRVDVRFLKRGASVNTTADVAIGGLQYRRFDLGDATAAWTSHGASVKGRLAFGGTSGRLTMAGTFVAATHAPLEKFFERSHFDGAAHLRGLDLGVWLPALGYQLPVGGRVDADATIAGPMRDPDATTTFSLAGGSIGRFPVDRLDVTAVSTLRKTTITRATLDLASLEITGSGSVGLGANDPISLALHAKTADVGTLAAHLADAGATLTGAAEADVKVDGTRERPRVSGGFDLEHGSFHGVALSQALGEFSFAGRDLVLSDAEIGLAKGTLFLAGSVPLVVEPFGFGPPNTPITLDFNAKDIDLANFAPLLPRGSALNGTLDGHFAIGGTAGNPRLDGTLAVTNGAILTPFETVPLESIGAQVTFSGNAARLDRLHATAAGGTLDASGNVRFASLVRPSTDAAYQFEARASHLGLDLPAFGSGQVDGTLALTHAAHELPSLAGSIALSDATIPFAALLSADTGAGGFDTSTALAGEPLDSTSDVALNLDLAAQRNVRVRSANVDIGARGSLHVGGTRAAPSLLGTFTSTGGTLSYFNTVFRLIDGTVAFQPDLGVVPNLDARAVTHVLNPDPNTVRNVTGGADVTLGLHGPVTNLSITLTSDPPYAREQILGLLLSAPALGATTLFAQSGQPTLYGSTTSTAPAGALVPRTTNGEFSVAQEAFGVANAQFTRTLLAPIESTVADAVGLTNIAVNVDYTGNVGLTARKILGKNVNAIYGTSFGYPYRQTFGFEIKPNDLTAAQITVFQTLGAYGLSSLTPLYLEPNNLKIQAAEPNQGTAGFSLSLQRLF